MTAVKQEAIKFKLYPIEMSDSSVSWLGNIPNKLIREILKSKYFMIPLRKQSQISTNPNSSCHGGL